MTAVESELHNLKLQYIESQRLLLLAVTAAERFNRMTLLGHVLYWWYSKTGRFDNV